MSAKVLFVDDDPQVTQALKRSQRKESYEVLTANSADDALEILARDSIDVVVSDEQMPGMPGSEFLARVRERYPDTIRIILTGQGNLDSAIRAINEGEIYRFLTKPCNEVDLAVTIRHALEHRALMVLSRKLLKENEAQAAVLRELEKEYPGITSLKKNAMGTLLLDEDETDGPGDSTN